MVALLALVAYKAGMTAAQVQTAEDLATAFRAGQSDIVLSGNITGFFRESSGDPFASARYNSFPEVPDECLQDTTACSEAIVQVATATVVRGVSDDVVWDLGFLRRRLLLRQNLTITGVDLQGLFKDVEPYIFWFAFANSAALHVVNASVSSDCAGGNTDYFLTAFDVVSPGFRNTVNISQDKMSFQGSLEISNSDDTASGSQSGQVFNNVTLRCEHDLLSDAPVDSTLHPEEACQSSEDKGASYRGIVNTTLAGFKCQDWAALSPNFHTRTPTAYPTFGLVENYCRNPDDTEGVWCYTLDGPRWERCAVPLCVSPPSSVLALAAGVAAAEASPTGARTAEDAGGSAGGLSWWVWLAMTCAVALFLVAAVAAVFVRRSSGHLTPTPTVCASHSKSTAGKSSPSLRDGLAEGEAPPSPPLDCATIAPFNNSSNREQPSNAPSTSSSSGPALQGAPSSGATPVATALSSDSRKTERSMGASADDPLDELRAAIAGMGVDEGQFVLQELIGRGGFGSVYRGLWKGMVVAIKTVAFRGRSVTTGNAQQRAIAEAAITFALSHPNVVSTYFHDIKPVTSAAAGGKGPSSTSSSPSPHPPEVVSDWNLFLVQEFCEMGSLRHAIDCHHFLTPAGKTKVSMCVDCLLDVARGMKYIQSRSIIHGDLNPSNVLLRAAVRRNNPQTPGTESQVSFDGTETTATGPSSSTPLPAALLRGYGCPPVASITGSISTLASSSSRGQSGVHPCLDVEAWQCIAKVCDFGLAVKTDPEQPHVSNVRQGTPFYIAPEVHESGHLSMAADSHAFGVMMWECYHSVAPYRKTAAGRVVRRRSFPRFPKDCPLSYAVLAMSCLTRDPLDRPNFYQIVGVLEDLSMHIKGHVTAETAQAHVTLLQLESAESGTRRDGGAPAGRPEGQRSPHIASSDGASAVSRAADHADNLQSQVQCAISAILSRVEQPTLSSGSGAAEVHGIHSARRAAPSMSDTRLPQGRAINESLHSIAADEDPRISSSLSHANSTAYVDGQSSMVVETIMEESGNLSACSHHSLGSTYFSTRHKYVHLYTQQNSAAFEADQERHATPEGGPLKEEQQAGSDQLGPETTVDLSGIVNSPMT